MGALPLDDQHAFSPCPFVSSNVPPQAKPFFFFFAPIPQLPKVNVPCPPSKKSFGCYGQRGFGVPEYLPNHWMDTWASHTPILAPIRKCEVIGPAVSADYPLEKEKASSNDLANLVLCMYIPCCVVAFCSSVCCNFILPMSPVSPSSPLDAAPCSAKAHIYIHALPVL